jgi:proteasome lid subunit RPN8/RPN11
MVRLDKVNALIVPPLDIPNQVITRTIEFLQSAGQADSEGIVLWLGRREPESIKIVEAFVPVQTASSHRFRIPPAGMAALMSRLGETGTFVAAQVHSHPQKAFHSLADDKMAIIGHVGACSLVLPYFAVATTTFNFVDQSALFCLDTHGEWVESKQPVRSQLLRIK